MKLSCLCGQIRIEARRPDFIHECNCTLCKKSGARWGYFQPSEVTLSTTGTGPANSYTRQDKDDPSAQLHFCANCGATTHFVLTPSAIAKFGNGIMGVNMWLADESDLAGVELRFPDGQAWSGAGDFSYVREARVIGC